MKTFEKYHFLPAGGSAVKDSRPSVMTRILPPLDENDMTEAERSCRITQHAKSGG